MNDWSGGVNSFDATSALDDNESPLMYNMTGDREGVLRLGSSEAIHPVLGAKLQTNTFVPGNNLHLMQSDYNIKGGFVNSGVNPPFHIITGAESWIATSGTSADQWSVNASSTGLALTSGKGIVYNAGHASYADAYVKYTCHDDRKIYRNKWYAFYMLMVNENHQTQTKSDGWIELLLGVTAGSGNRMRPNKYSRAWVTGAGNPRGGVYIHPHQSQITGPFSRVTSSTTDYYTVVASGICQAPSTVPEAGGDIYLYGHLNGTTTSNWDDWRIVQFCLSEVPSDVDHETLVENRHNTEGEIIVPYGASFARWDGANFQFTGHASMKTWDGSVCTDEAKESASATLKSTTGTYQGDNLFRISEGTFTEDIDSWILGPIVASLVDTEEDSLDAGDARGVDLTNSAYAPELRTYITKAQDPNSTIPRQITMGTDTNTTENNQPLILLKAAGTGTNVIDDYNAQYEMCHGGSVCLQVVQGGASDPDEINDDWKKTWIFGLSYKLRDNSYTNVRQAYTHDMTGTGPLWSARIIDAGAHDTNSDGKKTGKTISFASGGSTSDGILYVKNKALVGIEWSGNNSAVVGDNDLCTIAATEMGGSGNNAYAVANTVATLDTNGIDMTAWTKNPRMSFSFKEDPLPPNLVIGNNSSGEYHENLYHKNWWNTSRPYAFGDNFRDPRINGFIIWAYAKEDVSDHADTPWNPIFEVDLDKKRFLNYTYNRIEENLVLDRRFNGYKNDYSTWKKYGEWTTYWTSGAGFDSFDVGAAGYHHNKAPGIELTYKELIGYNSDETLGVRFKCATILNGRAVVGNLLRGNTQFPDRISVSSALTYDTFPQSEARDVSLNDGEDIIALAGFADKLLVYKKSLMYVVNFTDPDNWFVEGTYNNYGVTHKSSVVISDYGVSWFNQHTGVLHFDGQQVVDLTKDKLDFNDFGFGLTNGVVTDTHITCLGFETKSKELYVRIDANKNGTGDGSVSSKHGWCYSFKSQDWYLTYALYDNETDDTAEAQTNFINTNDGDLVFYRTNTGGSIAYPLSLTTNATGFRKISPSVRLTPDADAIAKYQSKEMDFGDAAIDKIIYKVIIKHRFGTASGDGWAVKGIPNGNYGDIVTLSNTLSDDDGDWTITEHECGSEFKNIKTFAIELVAPTSNNDPAFEVDSINVIYRTKHAK